VEHDSTTGIRITQNSISCNGGLGIDNVDGGNTELSPPIILNSDGAGTYGTAPPNSAVEVFSDDWEEGRLYEGVAYATTSGDWYFTGSVAGRCVTAVALDNSGNTSEFSLPWMPTDVAGPAADPLPSAPFSLHRNTPNPFNPRTTITYHLPEAGRVDLSIYDPAGRLVERIVDEWQRAGSHSAVWSPRDGSVASGIYLYRLESGGFAHVRKMTLIR
jgi:hypothetical protein